MNSKVELGNKYKLARAAVQMGDFSVAELADLTSVPPGTIGHFIHELTLDNYITNVTLAANGRGRPRKSYQLAEGGRKHLLNYMHRIRLQLEPDGVPFPEAKIRQEPNLLPVCYPVFTGYEAGASYFVCGLVPGLRMKDLVLNLEVNRIRVEATKPKDVLPAWTPKDVDVDFVVEGFVRDIDLPPGFGKPIVQRQVIRNGILTIELRKPSQAASVSLQRFAAKKAAKR
jgi:HSP20 family molecular chaperone IbpA